MLSMVSAVTRDEVLLDFDQPRIDPGQFLRVLNTVRWQLESGNAADVRVKSVDTGLRLKSDKWKFAGINESLKALDEQLSARYDLVPNEWRKKVLRQLAATRRTIVQGCEIASPKDRDNGIQGAA
ncbi:hypothetical protein [Paucibacter sp. KCTC 42545]|uniref:hypothetical protein n=1 Tax=Paucibacter sp. KCTC 42545 TaxID=1768242 RepID=UPI000733A149|nr:hypothetical protein [Paucibacter sp. KCTC 42545]ALT77949.1 hypothetical protein AT984_12930 [Paucibacter sp. KCTC 42545]